MGMFWVSIPQNPSAPESVDTKFGIGVAEITLGIVAICFIVLAPIAFLLGNRLYCRRWRVFFALCWRLERAPLGFYFPEL